MFYLLTYLLTYQLKHTSTTTTTQDYHIPLVIMMLKHVSFIIRWQSCTAIGSHKTYWYKHSYPLLPVCNSTESTANIQTDKWQ